MIGFKILKLHFLWPSWKANENIKFLRKKEAWEQAFFCNSGRVFDTICQVLGHTGPRKCNNNVFRVPLKMVKGRGKGRKHRTSWKAVRIVSCYLKPGGKGTLSAWNQSEKEPSVSHRVKDRTQNPVNWEPPPSSFSLSYPSLLFHQNKIQFLPVEMAQ